MNYAEMTDFEINKLVAAACLAEWYDNGTCVIKCDDDDRSIFQPCNSWADAGPIIEKHLICLAADVFAEPQDGGKWVAQPAYGWDRERVRSDNPLRAAMIVFLMMQESK